MSEDPDPAQEPSNPAAAVSTSALPPLPPASQPSPPLPPVAMPPGSGKRRTMSFTAASLRSDLDAALANHPPAKVAAFAAHSSSQDGLPAFPFALCDLRSSRRKRFVFYSVAFATMLALSSVLDIRRASLRQRQAKVHLSLPAGSSLSSLSDNSKDSDSLTAGQPAPASADVGSKQSDPVLNPRPLDGISSGGSNGAQEDRASTDNHDDKPGASSPTLSNGVLQPPSASDGDASAKQSDVNLSEQELKDDVDQLIAHVDEEASQGNATAGAAAPAAPPSDSTDAGSVPSTEERAPAAAPVSSGSNSAGPAPGSSSSGADSSSSGANTNVSDSSQSANSSVPDTSESEVRLNSEEHFLNAQKRMEALMSDDGVKKFADENDMRILHALALQATRGDCEQRSGAAGGSLFKTDAEAASNVDIERTDPLWGAWCLFMGSYKTDAMRDYVTKQRVVEDKMLTARTNAETNTTEPTTPFDPNAASLDDVMTPEQQSSLRQKADTISSHLRENDVRYLAALSLQATFGDCGPYGREVQAAPSDGEDAVELRKLREPLLDQTVIRREGSQWGAWCVLQGTKRTAAGTELARRVGLLVDQLSKSQQTASQPENGSDASQIAKTSARLADTSTLTDEGLIS